MLRRRIKSALYIDFENVPLPPDAIANWLAWLEDGVFDPSGARRRFLQKRVYWNSHAERNRELFQRHGFAAILIGKYSGLKNGADIRMAMDVVEATYNRADIDEFILLTGDSDFVPVIERLKEKSKRSAIVATEHRPNIHTTYHRSADLLIPSRRLTEAAQYRRPTPGLLARLLRRSPAPTRIPGKVQDSPAVAKPDAGRQDAPPIAPATTPARDVPEPLPALEMAAKRVMKLLNQQPRNYVSQKRVLAELDRVASFRRQGQNAYFGTGSYKALMRELSLLDPRISVVDQPGGGTGVVYIPPSPPGAETGASASSKPMPNGLPVSPQSEPGGTLLPTLAVNGTHHPSIEPEPEVTSASLPTPAAPEDGLVSPPPVRDQTSIAFAADGAACSLGTPRAPSPVKSPT